MVIPGRSRLLPSGLMAQPILDSKVLSLSLQTLVEEEPLQSLFSPVLQEVFITVTDFR